jgi:histone deacetylase 6
MIRIDVEPVSDEIVALCHSKSQIEKVKDSAYDYTDPCNPQPLKSKHNTHKFTKDTYEN